MRIPLDGRDRREACRQHPLPAVPCRQWVLSFPIPLRLLFAQRPEVLSAVLAVVARALSGDVIRRAGKRRREAETGVVTRCLLRTGVLVVEAEQSYLDVDTAPDDALAGLADAAVRYRIAVGPLAGQRTMRLGVPALTEALHSLPGSLTASHDGFSLNAAVACGARERNKLERLCRYMARGPLSNERLSIDGDGLVVHELKRPFRDGTTQCLFEPLDFLARLAALIPRPRCHLVRYHGVFAPNARHRALLVANPRVRTPSAADEPRARTSRAAMTWIQRLRRVYAIDVSVCPKCGGALKVLAVITDPQVITSILAHLDKREARAPPVAV